MYAGIFHIYNWRYSPFTKWDAPPSTQYKNQIRDGLKPWFDLIIGVMFAKLANNLTTS